MSRLRSTATIARRAAAATLATLAIGATFSGVPHAGADPKFVTSLVTVGSDTTQDVLNALAGEANGTLYTPVRSSQASTFKQITSWDATGSECISPKAPGASFQRPNGSTNGRRALSRAMDGTNWGPHATLCGGPKPVSGLVDFARSSAGPSGTGTALTYIPFGRDALSFAYYRSSGAPVVTLTTAQLQSVFKIGPQTIGGVEIVGCGIQTGSGTYQFWNGALKMAATEEATGTATCNSAGTGQRLQENDPAGLKAKGDSAALANKQVIVAYSAAAFISQINGKAPNPAAPGVDLGAIDALGKPYAGTAPNATPNSTFYASSDFGRDVYNVVPTSKIGGLASSNLDFKSLFVGTTSAICSAGTVINAFGFGTLSNCGATTLTGPTV